MKKILLLFFISPLYLFAQLQSVNNFGANPGNLAMYMYVPATITSDAGVVVAMHGCTQTAQTFADLSGWNDLADRYNFIVVYPEQLTGNNSFRCFNWFELGDMTKGQGETQSIKSMADYAVSNYAVNTSKIFVSGFSSGGAMTCVMAAAYPDFFAAGACMAGVPYKAALSSATAFTAMSPGIDKTPETWGDLVRGQNSAYNGPWPTMAIFHGTEDATVSNFNVMEITEQWTNVHSSDAIADFTNNAFAGNSNVTQNIYEDTNGTPVVISYDFIGLGHAIAVDPGTGEFQGGTTGSYSTDFNFYSCYYAVEFWGLTNTPVLVAAPENLTAATSGTTSINLSWADLADNELNYHIERSLTPGSGFTEVAVLPANATAYSDTGLAESTTYYYQVYASNAEASSSYSNEAFATTGMTDENLPTAPTGLSLAVSGTNSITLYWQDQANNETGYEIYCNDNNGSGFVLVATTAPDITSFTDTGLNTGFIYSYKILAVNSFGNSAFSNTVTGGFSCPELIRLDNAVAPSVFHASNEVHSAGTISSSDAVTFKAGNCIALDETFEVELGANFTATIEDCIPSSTVTPFTISQETGNVYISSLNLLSCGQSFTIPEAATLVSVEVLNQSPLVGETLYIFAGNGPWSVPIYTQTNVNTGSGWQTITLNTPIDLTAGQYTFQFTAGSFYYAYTDVYSGGNFWYNGVAYNVFDAAFRVNLLIGQ